MLKSIHAAQAKHSEQEPNKRQVLILIYRNWPINYKHNMFASKFLLGACSVFFQVAHFSQFKAPNPVGCISFVQSIFLVARMNFKILVVYKEV